MAKKVKRKIKQKISQFAKNSRISKPESRRIGKISSGRIGTEKLTKMVNRYGKKNDVKVNRASDRLIAKTNVGYAKTLADIPGYNYGFGSPNNQTIVEGISSPKAIQEAAEAKKNYKVSNRGADLMGRINEYDYDVDPTAQGQLEALLADQAERDAELQRQEEERQRQFEITQRTMLGNQARSGQQATYQLGGAASRIKGGTSGFKRRKGLGVSRIMSGLNTNSGRTLNV